VPLQPKEILEALRGLYGESAAPPQDMFVYCLREICSFHTTEPKADSALRALHQIGLTPAALSRARAAKLKNALGKAGPFVNDRLQSLQGLLRLVQRDLRGDFESLFRRSRTEAKRLLKNVPGFGEFGSDRLLLLSGRHPILALDWHGTRVAVRLGYGEEKRNFGSTYSSVQRELGPLLGDDPGAHYEMRELLRTHGRELCRKEGPICSRCPLEGSCSHAAHLRSPMPAIRFASH
jgi:endonuclease-3 related protein